MQINSNIDDVIAKFKAIAQKAAEIDVSAALVVGMNAGLGQMKNRIFNQRQDAAGASLGKYTGKKGKVTGRYRLNSEDPGDASVKKLAKKQNKRLMEYSGEDLTPYEKKRVKHGRQIAEKDLEFDGDLRRAMVLGSPAPREVNAIINNARQSQVAGYQEQQIARIRGQSAPVVIFSPSEDEKQTVRDNTSAALKQIYDRIFNTTTGV